MSSQRRTKHTKPPSSTSKTFRMRRTGPNANGNKFSPGSNPPDITVQPFNHTTLVMLVKGTVTITKNEIVQKLIAQIDPNNYISADRVILNFKIQSVRAWNTVGRTISLACYDFSAAYYSTKPDKFRSAILATMMDVAGKDSFPNVGYHYSNSHRNYTIMNEEAQRNNDLFTITSANSDAVIIYINLLWKFDGVPKFPTTVDLLQNLYKESRKQTEFLKNISDSQPSLIGKVVDGVKDVASLVAVAADDVTMKLLQDLLHNVELLNLAGFDNV